MLIKVNKNKGNQIKFKSLVLQILLMQLINFKEKKAVNL